MVEFVECVAAVTGVALLVGIILFGFFGGEEQDLGERKEGEEKK